jgi:hypothetical protein
MPAERLPGISCAMKILLLFCFVCVGAFAGKAASVYGTVYDASTSKGMAGQTVYVLDSLANYFDSSVTNASGAYSIQLSGSVDTNDVLVIYTKGCGKTSYGFHQFSGASILADFYICPALYSLNGTVSLNGAQNNGQARLLLVSKHLDSLSHDTVLTVVDTIFTEAYGGGYSKSYSVIPTGNLFLKAELLPSHPQYGKYLPTWLGSALVWSSAQPLSAVNFSVSNATPLSLIPALSLGGTARASGIVMSDGSSAGKPLEGRLLLLTNATGTPVGFTYSDSAGQFAFEGLAFSTYKLFGDSWGRLNPALTFTLTATRPNVDDIIFEEDSVSFRGRMTNATGIANGGVWSTVSVFPNPVRSALRITGLNAVAGEKSLWLRNMTGALLQQKEHIKADALDIELGALPTGIYMLEIRAASGIAVFKVQKQ